MIWICPSPPSDYQARGDGTLLALFFFKHFSHLCGGEASFLAPSGAGPLQHSDELRVGAQRNCFVVCVVQRDQCRQCYTLVHDHDRYAVHLLHIISEWLCRVGQLNLFHSCLSSPPMKTRLPRLIPTATTVTVWGASVTS